MAACRIHSLCSGTHPALGMGIMKRSTSDPAPSPPLRVADVLGVLPDMVELRPFLDLLMTRSVADPTRRWSGSGELGTVGDRVVDPEDVATATVELAKRESERIVAVLRDAACLVEQASRSEWQEVVDTMIELGRRDEGHGKAGAAEKWYLAAHRISRDRGFAGTPTPLRLAARAARTLSSLEQAAERYEAAWSQAGELGRMGDRITAAIGRGNVDVDRGIWDGAERWYGRALADLGEEGPARPERWQVLHNLAIVRRRGGDLEGARRYLERAAREGARAPDRDVEEKVENGWGQLLMEEGDFRGAQLHFERALEVSDSAGARVAILSNLGESLLKQGRTLEAAERARQAEATALAGSVTSRLPEVYRLLGSVSLDRGEDDGFVFLEEALRIIRERGLPPYEEARTRESYGDLRLTSGDVGRGLGELGAAATIYRSIGMLDAARRLEERIGRHAADDENGDEA